MASAVQLIDLLSDGCTVGWTGRGAP